MLLAMEKEMLHILTYTVNTRSGNTSPSFDNFYSQLEIVVTKSKKKLKYWRIKRKQNI